MMKGFTLLEILLSMTIVSMVSVATVYILFLSLNLRDVSLATVKNDESVRIFEHQLRMAVVSAKTVTGGGNSLFISTPLSCYSYVYDSQIKNIRYSIINQAGCSPDPSPNSLYFSLDTKITSFNFVITPIVTGGKQIFFTATVQTTLPLSTNTENFSGTFNSLLD